MRRRHLDAPRGIAPLSRSRRPDQTGVSPRRVYPAAARCMWPGVNVASHAHGYRIPSHPSNASRSSAPRGGRNGANIGRPSQLVKHDSRKMTFFIVHTPDLFDGEKSRHLLREVPTFFAQSAAANFFHGGEACLPTFFFTRCPGPAFDVEDMDGQAHNPTASERGGSCSGHPRLLPL